MLHLHTRNFILSVAMLASCSIVLAQAAPQDGAGAYATGNYRNLFLEDGHAPQETHAKIDAAYQQLFHGDPQTQAIVFSVGKNSNGPLMYLTDWNNHDVRTEGMSYGMMIAVQLDKKADFDALWNWTKTYMYISDPKHPSYGYFSWSCKIDGTPNEETPAPDGEEYFAMALLFAGNRWPGGQGIYDYHAEALKLLTAMRHRAVITGPTKFGPRTVGAEVSRAFFVKATNPQTGLAPDYANFDGTPCKMPFSSNSSNFAYDAWRTASNWSVDWSWWRKAPAEQQLSDRIQSFFLSQGIDTYGPVFSLDGKLAAPRKGSTPEDHAPGLIGTNAVAGLAATDKARAKQFTEALWNTPIPSGQSRYYDGMLYMMSFMHLSGEYRIWTPAVAARK